MKNALDVLVERGFVQQCTDPEGLREMLGSGSAVFYCGFDPTASSLHAGSLMPIMAMAHLQHCGHIPIALIGGGTAMVGDPSGKTEMRRMMTIDEIRSNAEGIRENLSRFIQIGDGAGMMVNNADWLLPLNYIDFLRDIGRHFRVNEMIKMEAYRQRLEREEGLSFLEFNYQILQAFDFLTLSQNKGCRLQIGGDDQWGNILAGTDLTRRISGTDVFGVTFPLLTTARGEKMGKTHKGTIWLDPARTSPYEYYQYWINTDDSDVRRFLAFFTFLPMDEVSRLADLKGADLRRAKETLALEATRLAHGDREADQAQTASRAAFGGLADDMSAIPATEVERARLEQGIPILDLLMEAGLTKSRGEGRRLIQQGGGYIGGDRIGDPEALVGLESVNDDSIMLRFGKKRYHRVIVR